MGQLIVIRRTEGYEHNNDSEAPVLKEVDQYSNAASGHLRGDRVRILHISLFSCAPSSTRACGCGYIILISLVSFKPDMYF